MEHVEILEETQQRFPEIHKQENKRLCTEVSCSRPFPDYWGMCSTCESFHENDRCLPKTSAS